MLQFASLVVLRDGSADQSTIHKYMYRRVAIHVVRCRPTAYIDQFTVDRLYMTLCVCFLCVCNTEYFPRFVHIFEAEVWSFLLLILYNKYTLARR